MDTADESVIKMWNDYLKSIGESAKPLSYTAWAFGLTARDADELAGLVLAGIKRATASLLCEAEYDKEPVPKKGDISIILGGGGKAKCVIRTTAVNIVPFMEVAEEFARKEGEDDRSLESWRDVHRRFFTIGCRRIGKKFNEDMPVICQEFEVVFQ